jgi:hypothetical protein
MHTAGVELDLMPLQLADFGSSQAGIAMAMTVALGRLD